MVTQAGLHCAMMESLDGFKDFSAEIFSQVSWHFMDMGDFRYSLQWAKATSSREVRQMQTDEADVISIQGVGFPRLSAQCLNKWTE